MNPAELLELAEGDTEAAGWLCGQLLDGHERGEVLSVMQTAKTNLERLRPSAERGDGTAVLSAVRVCIGMRGYPMPTWLRERMSNAIAERLDWDSTLDVALGLPPFKQVDKERDRRMWAGYIWQRVEQLRDEGDGIGEGMFDQIAGEIVEMLTNMGTPDPRMSWSKVRTIYYETKFTFE